MEKILCKKKEDAKVRKMVSRRKLGKLEIRRSKKITKEQVPLSHVIKDRDVRKITEALDYTAKQKAKEQVKLFRKTLYNMLDQYSVADISKATKIPYYKVNRTLMWKRKNPLKLMYTWKLPQSVREEVADFFRSSLISYELPDMRYFNKQFMQMSVKEKLLASNISLSWSRWVRPNNVETNSKKNAKTKEEEQNEDGRKNTNGKKQKEKKKFKALMIEEKTGTAIDLLNAYIEDVQVMKHHFYNVWQTYQFMLNKANLQPNQIILVQDFARNFVLNFQDEPKDLHWYHD